MQFIIESLLYNRIPVPITKFESSMQFSADAVYLFLTVSNSMPRLNGNIWMSARKKRATAWMFLRAHKNQFLVCGNLVFSRLLIVCYVTTTNRRRSSYEKREKFQWIKLATNTQTHTHTLPDIHNTILHTKKKMYKSVYMYVSLVLCLVSAYGVLSRKNHWQTYLGTSTAKNSFNFYGAM